MQSEDATDGEVRDPGVTPVHGAAPGPGCPREGGPPPADGPDPGDRPRSEAEVRELLARAGQGDRTVLPALRRLLDARPALWQLAGDVGRTALADWIDLIADGDLLVRASLRRTVAAMMGAVAGPAPAPLERLLAERVVAGWLQAGHADAAFARLKGQDPSLAQLELMQRRQERAQKTYLAAIKALATVRRLGVAAAPVPAAAAAAKADGATPRRGRPGRGRVDRVEAPEARPEAAGGRPARGGRKPAGKAEPGGEEAVVPQALRDRMRGLVAAEN